APPQLLAAVPPAELLDAVRQHGPDFLVLDADGEDPAALRALATKVMLVSDARIVVVSAYLAPGSPGLCGLLQTIAGTFAHKPQGPSSLGLADDDGPAFVAALRAAFAAHDNQVLDGAPPAGGHAVDVDDAWDADDAKRGAS